MRSDIIFYLPLLVIIRHSHLPLQSMSILLHLYNASFIYIYNFVDVDEPMSLYLTNCILGLYILLLNHLLFFRREDLFLAYALKNQHDSMDNSIFVEFLYIVGCISNKMYDHIIIYEVIQIYRNIRYKSDGDLWIKGSRIAFLFCHENCLFLKSLTCFVIDTVVQVVIKF